MNSCESCGRLLTLQETFVCHDCGRVVCDGLDCSELVLDEATDSMVRVCVECINA